MIFGLVTIATSTSLFVPRLIWTRTARSANVCVSQ
ncbi:Uncharacterised protein [Vibrio cholerae]|nr:Uncharacterised protein [Vibrio cholerae]